VPKAHTPGAAGDGRVSGQAYSHRLHTHALAKYLNAAEAGGGHPLHEHQLAMGHAVNPEAASGTPRDKEGAHKLGTAPRKGQPHGHRHRRRHTPRWRHPFSSLRPSTHLPPPPPIEPTCPHVNLDASPSGGSESWAGVVMPSSPAPNTPVLPPPAAPPAPPAAPGAAPAAPDASANLRATSALVMRLEVALTGTMRVVNVGATGGRPTVGVTSPRSSGWDDVRMHTTPRAPRSKASSPQGLGDMEPLQDI
jgi:hypothetical protein